jgi:hypothetical protein
MYNAHGEKIVKAYEAECAVVQGVADNLYPHDPPHRRLETHKLNLALILVIVIIMTVFLCI